MAYYPSYLTTTSTPSLSGFVDAWLSLGVWPAGPAWFLWVLLAFDVLAAALFRWAPSLGNHLGRPGVGARARPTRFVVVFVALSLLAYLPMALAFDPLRWSAAGPFTLQTSCILNYLLYFLIGIGVGAYGLDGGLLALARAI